MQSPRDAAGNATESNGTEAWASSFLYPNEWSLTCHKKVAIVDPDASWAMHRTDDTASPLWILAALLLLALLNLSNFWSYSFTP